MLNQFIAKVKNTGIAKTNRYRVSITMPSAISSYTSSNRLITLFCESTALPGINISTAQQRIIGEARELPYEKIYSNVALSFYIDNNFEVKEFFDAWVNAISNSQNKITSYYKDYIAPTIVIDILPIDSETAIYSITLHEAYPKATSNIQIAADSKDVAKILVSINYKYYTTTKSENKYAMGFEEDDLLSRLLNIPQGFGQQDIDLVDVIVKPKDKYAITEDTDLTEYFALLATDMISTQASIARAYAFI